MMTHHCKHCGQRVHESDDFHDCEVKGMLHEKSAYLDTTVEDEDIIQDEQ